MNPIPSSPPIRADARVRAGLVLALALAVPPFVGAQAAPGASGSGYVANDVHFHLTNYVQQGTDIR